MTISSLTTCGWSRQAEGYFRRRGVRAVAIESDTAGPDPRQKISAGMRAEGADGFPFVRIGGKVVRGFDPTTYDRLLQGA